VRSHVRRRGACLVQGAWGVGRAYDACGAAPGDARNACCLVRWKRRYYGFKVVHKEGCTQDSRTLNGVRDTCGRSTYANKSVRSGTLCTVCTAILCSAAQYGCTTYDMRNNVHTLTQGPRHPAAPRASASFANTLPISITTAAREAHHANGICLDCPYQSAPRRRALPVTVGPLCVWRGARAQYDGGRIRMRRPWRARW
jgi:hypothetical protein